VKVAYLDTVAGISGDMTLAAFVSAGFPIDELSEEISKLNLAGVELEGSHVQRNGITAVKIEVVISGAGEKHRHLNEILGIIEKSSLSGSVKANAAKIFHEVATAEARVHNTSIEKIHFHEVGALDSIVDIVGAAICLDRFGIQAVYTSPIKLGSGGFAQTEHGKLPIPGPAALEILKGYPTILTDIPYELTTPTGAAIVKAMSSGVLSSERLIIEAIGYGAGTREIDQIPNLLRVMIGELNATTAEEDLLVVETNIDDMNPEIYPFVIDRLLESGANDAYLVPVIMKKGRPGILLSVMAGRRCLDEVLGIIFSQTTTIGVRIHSVDRRKLERTQREVKTLFGMVKVKVVVYDGSERLIPEFEECKRIAGEQHRTLREVYQLLTAELTPRV
jgi:uncharacterized protein (TIGR00299 family) protein